MNYKTFLAATQLKKEALPPPVTGKELFTMWNICATKLAKYLTQTNFHEKKLLRGEARALPPLQTHSEPLLYVIFKRSSFPKLVQWLLGTHENFEKKASSLVLPGPLPSFLWWEDLGGGAFRKGQKCNPLCGHSAKLTRKGQIHCSEISLAWCLPLSWLLGVGLPPTS